MEPGTGAPRVARGSPSCATGTGTRASSAARYGGGHGHPDRLHLTLHADGRHWLADPGTGSYVDRDLFWYRSTLAHNAPRLDGVLAGRRSMRWCEAFEVRGGWSLGRGAFGELSRTLVAGPEYLLDVVELSTRRGSHLLELPWHLAGAGRDGNRPDDWTADPWDERFLERVRAVHRPDRWRGGASGPTARTGRR